MILVAEFKHHKAIDFQNKFSLTQPK